MPYRLIRGAALAILVVAIIALSLALILHMVTVDHANATLVGCLAVLALAVALGPPAPRRVPVLSRGTQTPPGSLGGLLPDPDRPPELRGPLLC